MLIVFKILILFLWIYLLSIFHRGKLAFFKFIFGSIGTFLILMNFINIIKNPSIQLFTYILGLIGDKTNLFESYAEYGMFFINNKNTVISLYIDLECSGLIEIIVFLSLILFFPVYNLKEKLKLGIMGCVFIYIFNIIRIFFIVLLIYYLGTPIYAFAHSIFGRLIFYILIIILYFYIFTRGQLKKQKVGKFMYEALEDKKDE